MIVIQVTALSKPENVARLEQALSEVVAQTQSLEGCLRYEWFWHPTRAREAFVYAEFASDDAFAAYRKGPVVAKIGAEILPLLERRPSFKHFQATILEEG